MADWLPDSKPWWWTTVEEFARSPTSFILGIISTVIAGGLLNVGESITLALKQAFASFGIFGVVIADTLETAFGPIGTVILEIFGLLPTILGALSRSLGPFAPVIVIPGAFIMLWLASKLAERVGIFLSKRL